MAASGTQLSMSWQSQTPRCADCPLQSCKLCCNTRNPRTVQCMMQPMQAAMAKSTLKVCAMPFAVMTIILCSPACRYFAVTLIVHCSHAHCPLPSCLSSFAVMLIVLCSQASLDVVIVIMELCRSWCLVCASFAQQCGVEAFGQALCFNKFNTKAAALLATAITACTPCAVVPV